MADWRVLVAEDDRAVARIHCRYVSQQPRFTMAAVALTGAQARRLVDTLRPELVLLDLGLPGVDGISLLRELRTAGDPVEVIVITAHASPHIVRTAVQLGVVDYLVKPFWAARLAEALGAFATRMEALHGGRLNQADVDRVRMGGAEERRPAASAINQQRLRQVEALLAARQEEVSAEQLADLACISRVTARRYLEHLVSLGQYTVDHVADGPGRPRKVYRAWLSAPVGGVPPARAAAR